MDEMPATSVGRLGYWNRMALSENQLDRKLDLPRRIGRQNFAGSGGLDIHRRVRESGGVEGIEKLRPELQAYPLSEAEVLEKPGVPAQHPWPAQDIDAAFAIRECGRNSEGREIELAVDGGIGESPIAGAVGPLRLTRVSRVGTDRRRERRTGLRDHDTGKLPAPKCCCDDTPGTAARLSIKER
jgi:hypothetical protein